MKIEKGTLLQERYRIEEMIGEGGMSYVYKAEDIKLGRIVAIKVLKEEFAEDAEFVRKFQDEAKAAAKLNHLNIVSTFDTVDEGKLHFIVMELVEGITLKTFIQRKGRIPEREAIGIALQLIDGIDLAHKMGIVHRDIKPQNIIISTEGVVKIADFGIARAASQETVNTAVMGSVHYISPEQARHGVSDARSDIYSFSCTLYEMLTGTVPYAGENSMAVVFSHLEDPIPRIRNSVKDLSPALDYIVWRGMQKKASLRYQSIADMGEDLRLALEDPEGGFLADREKSGKKRLIGRNGLDRGISNLYKGMAAAAVILIVAVFLFLGYKVVGALRSVHSLSEESKASEKTTEESSQVAITISALDSLLPEIVGKTIPEAEELLKDYDIRIYQDKEEFSDDYSEGQIISYPAGKYNSHSRVYVTVSKGSEVIQFYDPKNPEDLSSLQKMSAVDLEEKLKERNVAYTLKEEPSDTVPKGYVIRTNKASTKDSGNLEITVSSGSNANLVAMPSLLGLSEDDAIDQLQSLGLVVGNITYVSSSTTEKDHVMSQSVAKDTYVEKGQSVSLTVSSGQSGKANNSGEKAWVSSINQSVNIGSGGPGVQGVVLVVVYLRQEINGESHYTTIQAPRSYQLGSEMQLSLSRIVGASGLSKGTIEVVDAENDHVLASYDLDFHPEG